MAGMRDLVNDYVGAALTPEDLRALALIQVKDASLQDDAVQRAVANAQGVEQRNRSALEDYIAAMDEQSRQESQRALEMAQQRYLANQNSIGLLASIVGLGKEGKRMLANLERDNQDILRAFPQIGKASEGEGAPEAAAGFDIAKMLESKDYSPETIAKLFETNDWDVWDQALRTGDLDLYQAMLDGKLGALPEGMADKMKFVIGGMPETSKALKLDDKYARLRGVIGETQGDIKKKAADEKKAAAKAKADAEDKKQTEADVAEMNRALAANNSVARAKFQTAEFKKILSRLKKKNLVKPEDEAKLKRIVGEF